MKKKLQLVLWIIVMSIFGNSQAQNYNITFRSQLKYPGQTNGNIWGYVDTLGNEYALVTTSDSGLSIVNVTHPDAPFQVAMIPGTKNYWHEVKTWGKYAYVTTDGFADSGLQIINLSKLPGTDLPYKYWKDMGNGDTLRSIHTLHIDNGFAYLYGSNLGVVFADLSDPWNPVYAGRYTDSYIHDGYVRNNVLYGAHMQDGFFSIMDVSDKTKPVVLQTRQTPTRFPHNNWLSNDSKTLFTTDETHHSYLTAYDISDLSNIEELDRIRSNSVDSATIHNVHILNDWAVNAHYTDGVTIIDAHRPQNLVQVAHYDPYPLSLLIGQDFIGAWGVYPYLPSGNLIMSSITKNQGLFVLTPTYIRASYLKGVIRDSLTGQLLDGVNIEILKTTAKDRSDFSGEYKTGIAEPGTYDIKFSKTGYYSKIVAGVSLASGIITELDVQLAPLILYPFSGKVIESTNGAGIANAQVRLYNENFTFDTITDSDGNFSLFIFPNAYVISAGKWGYITRCFPTKDINSSSEALVIQLDQGYYDDFSFDFGWKVTGDATAGNWDRCIPKAPNSLLSDVNSDCSIQAYVTGNPEEGFGDEDVDQGKTILTSPVFNLSSYHDPYLKYYKWFSRQSPGDYFSVKMTNGIDTIIIEKNIINADLWIKKIHKVKELITPTATMRLILTVCDTLLDGEVKGGFDQFEITEGPTEINENKPLTASLKVYPNPFNSDAIIEYRIPNTNNIKDTWLNITDITGRLIESIQLQAATGTISFNNNISEGVYFVRIVSKTEMTAPVKIVKLY